jgi:Rieske Fe-S protein
VSGRFTTGRVDVNVAGTALTAEGGAALVESVAGVYLLARTSANSFTAVEAVCTHEGCTVSNADGDQYVCPCHGSRYTRSGQVVRGPAVASLRRYTTSFTDGVVTIAI